MRKQKNIIKIVKPTKLILNDEKIIIQETIRAPVKKQNNGGARITVSQNYADYEAVVFITNKKVISR